MREVLDGDLAFAEEASGLVIFAHGSGSSRFSARNRLVAERLREKGFATLLLDLLTPEEEEVDRGTRQLRFDVDLLALRLVGTIDWATERPDVGSLPIGLFGASTGAAGALLAAAARPLEVAAVVSRGGRPDLARRVLGDVTVPTLLIVGARDPQVLELNRAARAQLRCPTSLRVVPGATHLFEEPGALDEVAQLAARWFTSYLVQ